MITKIRNTVHTAGIISFSMYRHLTQPSGGIPKQTKGQDSKFSLNTPHQELSLKQANLEKLDDVKFYHRFFFSCFSDKLLLLFGQCPVEGGERIFI